MVGSLVLLSAGALLGLGLVSFLMRGRLPPTALGLTHGGLGLAGVTWLIVVGSRSGISLLAWVAVAMFVITGALGGLQLFFHLTRKEVPAPLVVLHGMAAASGLGLLAVALAGIG